MSALAYFGLLRLHLLPPDFLDIMEALVPSRFDNFFNFDPQFLDVRDIFNHVYELVRQGTSLA